MQHNAIVVWEWWRFAVMTREDGGGTWWLVIRLHDGREEAESND